MAVDVEIKQVERDKALRTEKEQLQAEMREIAEENEGKHIVQPDLTIESQNPSASSTSSSDPPRSQNWHLPGLQVTHGEFTSVGGNQDTYVDSVVHTNTSTTTMNVQSITVFNNNQWGFLIYIHQW